MSVLLALASALAWGVSDFVGGLCSRRQGFLPVVLVTQLAATVTVFVAIAATGDRVPAAGPLAWGGLSGLGTAVGGLFLYRGFMHARIAVVAPLSAVGATVVPVAVGVGLGERPSVLAGVGIACAVPAVVLIARPTPGTQAAADASRPSGVLDGVLAGGGFGLLFVALQRAGTDHGLWPVGVGQLVAACIIAAAALWLRGFRPPPRAVFGGSVLAGVLAAVATLLYFLSTGHGLLVLVAVLAALYPGFTVLLARFVLHERMGSGQQVGLGLAAVAIVLIVV